METWKCIFWASSLARELLYSFTCRSCRFSRLSDNIEVNHVPALSTDELPRWTNLQSDWLKVQKRNQRHSNHPVYRRFAVLIPCIITGESFQRNLIWDIGVAACPLGILSAQFPLTFWVFPTWRLSHQLAFSPSDQPVNRHPQKILKRKFVLTTNNQSIPDILVRRCPWTSFIMFLFETQNIGGRSQQKILRSRPNLSIFGRPMPLRHQIRRIVHCNDIHSSWDSRMTVIRIFLHRPHSLDCLFQGNPFLLIGECSVYQVSRVMTEELSDGTKPWGQLSGQLSYGRKGIGSQRHLIYRQESVFQHDIVTG